jgi:hypothetical protein
MYLMLKLKRSCPFLKKSEARVETLLLVAHNPVAHVKTIVVVNMLGKVKLF